MLKCPQGWSWTPLLLLAVTLQYFQAQPQQPAGAACVQAHANIVYSNETELLLPVILNLIY